MGWKPRHVLTKSERSAQAVPLKGQRYSSDAPEESMTQVFFGWTSLFYIACNPRCIAIPLRR